MDKGVMNLTKSLNNQTVFFIITLAMVVFVSLVITTNPFAFQNRGVRQYPVSDSVTYGISGVYLLPVSQSTLPFFLLKLWSISVGSFSLFESWELTLFSLSCAGLLSLFGCTSGLATPSLIRFGSSALFPPLLKLWGSSPFGSAILALGSVTVLFVSVFIKVAKRLQGLAFVTLFHLPCSKLKHPRRLVVHCYHTSEQPPGVRINNSTAVIFGQLFYLCGKGNYSRFGAVLQ